jgi:hypothetical protein
MDAQTIGLAVNATAWVALIWVVWWTFGDLRRDP